MKFLELHHKAKDRRTRLRQELAQAVDPFERESIIRDQQRRLAPYPMLAIFMSAFLLTVSLYFIIVGLRDYNFIVGVMPVMGAIAVAIPTAIFLPQDIYRYVQQRKAKAKASRLGEAWTNSAPVRKPELVVSSQPEYMEMGVLSGSLGVAEATETLSDILTDSPNMALRIRDRSWGRHGQYRREVLAFAWLFALVGLCWLFGFPNGTAIFMVSYGLTCTRRYITKLHQRLFFAAISTGLLWILIYEMLHLTGLPNTGRIHF